MASKFVRKGRRLKLPIVAETVSEICLGQRGPVLLTFGDHFDTSFHIEDAITLVRGKAERVLMGSRPGTTFNIKELAPPLELFGETVVEALAEDTGSLRIRFKNELILSVVPSSGYEAWHFAAPGRGLTGTCGKLISWG